MGCLRASPHRPTKNEQKRESLCLTCAFLSITSRRAVCLFSVPVMWRRHCCIRRESELLWTPLKCLGHCKETRQETTLLIALIIPSLAPIPRALCSLSFAPQTLCKFFHLVLVFCGQIPLVLIPDDRWWCSPAFYVPSGTHTHTHTARAPLPCSVRLVHCT